MKGLKEALRVNLEALEELKQRLGESEAENAVSSEWGAVG